MTKLELNLEIMPTNLTHGRPVRMPFETAIYGYCARELGRLFPGWVMNYLDRIAAPFVVGDSSAPCPHCDGEMLRRFPEAPELPVVVATRMSLSFPGLVSAVPLYAVDFSRK